MFKPIFQCLHKALCSEGLTDLLEFKPVRGERQDRLARLPESYQSGCRDTVTSLTPLKNIKSEVVGCFIVQKEETEDIQESLDVFKVWNHDWMPSHFMVDKSNMEINALKTEFPAMELLEKINNSVFTRDAETEGDRRRTKVQRVKHLWRSVQCLQEMQRQKETEDRSDADHDNIIHYGPEEDIEANIFTHNDGFRSRSPDTVHFSPLTVESVGGHQGVEFWEAQEQAWIPFEAPKLSAFANFKKFYKAKQEVYASFNTSLTPVSVQERNVYYSPTCVVCLENPPVKVVWPCRHACLCRPYAGRLKILSSRCPVCRQEYQKDPESEAERRSWEEFQEDMAVLDSLDRIMDDPGKSEEQKAEARRKYEDYVRKMNERSPPGSWGSLHPWRLSNITRLFTCPHSQRFIGSFQRVVGQAGEAVSYFRNSFKPNLGELFRFFDYSACRMSRLHQIQEIMNLAQRTLKEAKDTRWLSHDEPCSALYKTLPAVLTSLDHKAPASIKLQATAAADPPVNSVLAQAHNTNVREYKDDTRKIVKFISAPGQLVHCPFNPAHVVKCCKVEDHFRKCSKDNASARDEIAHNIARNGQRRRYRRASRSRMTVLTMLLLERTQETIPCKLESLNTEVFTMAFDKDSETTFKVATPAAKTFLTRKVRQLEWDFADFAVRSSIPLGNITSYVSQLRQHSGVIMCDPRATIFVLPDFNEDQSKLMCKCNVIKCSTEVREKGVAVNSTLMKIQAKKLSGGVDSYKASNGWISCLKKRYGLSNRRKTSAAQKLPEDLQDKVLSFQRRMIQLREQYDYPVCDVFNMDETPLTFDMPSDWIIDYTGKKDSDFGQSIHRAGMSLGSSMSTQPSSNKWKGTLSFSAPETRDSIKPYSSSAYKGKWERLLILNGSVDVAGLLTHLCAQDDDRELFQTPTEKPVSSDLAYQIIESMNDEYDSGVAKMLLCADKTRAEIYQLGIKPDRATKLGKMPNWQLTSLPTCDSVSRLQALSGYQAEAGRHLGHQRQWRRGFKHSGRTPPEPLYESMTLGLVWEELQSDNGSEFVSHVVSVEELTVTAISPKLVPSAFPMCDDHHGGVSRRFQDARHKTVIYDSCNLHTYCLSRDPLLFKHTWFLMDRLLEEPQRSHDDSSIEGVTESSTVGCPVADADMAEESNQETAMDLRTVIPETQVHGQEHAAGNTTGEAVGPTHGHPRNSGYGQPSTSSAINQENLTIRLRATMVDEWLNNEDEYNTYVPDINMQDEAPRFLLRDQFDGDLGDLMTFHVCKNDCVLYTGDLMGATECPKCKETRFDDRGKAKKEYFYFPLLETVRTLYAVPKISSMLQEHGLTLSEDVPQYVSDIRETAML
ncbi:hypothetical protein Bbelb_283540 [Branchiostoma belcheri]|nr:hypothetical protein Bbelb_283540 [Branchiostoma belcheri]